MYNIIQHSHSGIMWLAVAMLVFSTLITIVILIKKKEDCFAKREKIFKFTKWLFYIQALLGIVLLFISEKVHFGEGFMKSKDLRFYGLEHPLMMLIVIALLAIGLFRAKKKPGNIQKAKTVLIFYSIALTIVLLMIPWKTVLSQNIIDSITIDNTEIIKSDIDSTKGPAIEFEINYKDLGEVKKGTELTYKYEFSNSGSEALIIDNVRTNCHCTIASCPKTPLVPGATNYIDLELDTKMLGQFTKTVAVYSNALNHYAEDIGQSRVILKIKWTVLEDPS